MIEFGQEYMAQIVANAQALAAALQSRGIPMLGAHKGFTRTHQVIADVRGFGGGLVAAQKLAEANIITNKNLIPSDRAEDWDRPGGLRIGTTEVTRLGMGTAEMERIADLMAAILVGGSGPAEIKRQAIEMRSDFREVRFCFKPAPHSDPPGGS